jgi:predicted nucleotidyltransferase component of viral defense system
MSAHVVTGFGLDDGEARTVADRFGVAIEQVRRDHLISHILAALSASHGEQVIFFGGTALARTHLPAGRLSEDIDLIATGARRETAAAIEQTLERALRRSHGRISWAPRLTAVRDTDAAVLLADEGRLTVRMQLLDHLGYPPWPTELHAIQQRYTDAGPARLRVPTAASFAAWKTVAWHDRRAPRDLWDLWALAQHGELTKRAAELFVAHGPIGNTPQPWMFTSAPTEERWLAQLVGQTRLTVSATEALQVVADACARASTKIIS